MNFESIIRFVIYNMKAKQLLSVIFLSTSLLAQGHMVSSNQNAVIVSFGYDRSVDFFGEGKFLRDSYNNSLNLSYIYNGFLGFDLSYGYSLFNSKDSYGDADNAFNFSDNFRENNPDISDQGFSLGLTYHLKDNEKMPIDMSFGLRYGNSDYDNDVLNTTNQDFYRKYYVLEVAGYTTIEANAQFNVGPILRLNFVNEKNIHDEIVIVEDITTSETVSKNDSHINIELGFPILFDQGAFQNLGDVQFIVEPTLSSAFGETHFGINVGFLFNN